MSDTDHESATPRFQVGCKVRARRGVTAPDFEDIPLGGWAGAVPGIEQVEGQIDYEVEWDRRTLDAMHPVYRKRCERDDLDPKAMWLGDDDLEPDDGSPVPIEPPTEIQTPPP